MLPILEIKIESFAETLDTVRSAFRASVGIAVEFIRAAVQEIDDTPTF